METNTMPSITPSVPEHSLRHPAAVTQVTGGANVRGSRTQVVESAFHPGDTSPDKLVHLQADTIGGRRVDAKSRVRPWPFTANQISPLAGWRTFPADLLRDAEPLLERAALDKVAVMRGGSAVTEALCGATAVAVAFSLMPIEKTTIEPDIAMTAVTRGALGGDPGAMIVVSHALGRATLDHPFAMALAASWLAHKRRFFPYTHGLTEAEARLVSVLREREATAAARKGGER